MNQNNQGNHPSDSNKVNHPSDSNKVNHPSDSNKVNHPSDSDRGNKPNIHLGNYCWLLGTDVWQLGAQKHQINKLFPDNPQLAQLIRIAQVLAKYQREITYYQARIKAILANSKNHEEAQNPA
jgi:hypothetical protein